MFSLFYPLCLCSRSHIYLKCFTKCSALPWNDDSEYGGQPMKDEVIMKTNFKENSPWLLKCICWSVHSVCRQWKQLCQRCFPCLRWRDTVTSVAKNPGCYKRNNYYGRLGLHVKVSHTCDGVRQCHLLCDLHLKNIAAGEDRREEQVHQVLLESSFKEFGNKRLLIQLSCCAS